MTDLPRGTVTFLFMDIEGSTSLLKELRDGYGELLADQRLLLRSAFEEHGGREVDMPTSFFHGVGGMGWRVHSLAGITPEGPLREANTRSWWGNGQGRSNGRGGRRVSRRRQP